MTFAAIDAASSCAYLAIISSLATSSFFLSASYLSSVILISIELTSSSVHLSSGSSLTNYCWSFSTSKLASHSLVTPFSSLDNANVFSCVFINNID